MRWNCPHCGTSLSLNAKKDAPAWSFARCYQCQGFALVRKNEPQRPIKVAPKNAALPPPPNAAMRGNAGPSPSGAHEGIGHGPSILSQRALKNWNAHQERKDAKNAAENLLSAQASRIPPRFKPKKSTVESVAQAWGATWNEALRIPLKDIAAALPEPLPEIPVKSARERIAPYVAVATGAFLMISGASILLRSEKIWQRPVSSTQAAPQRNVTPASAPQIHETLKVETSLIDRERSERAHAASHLAPTVPLSAPLRETKTELVTSTQQSAPTREETPEYFQARVVGLQLRAGPGTHYKTFGRASGQERFQVVGHRGDWNRIQLDGTRPGVPFAWVRRDLIEPTPQGQSTHSGN